MNTDYKSIEAELLKMKIGVESWEADEDILTFNGCPVGMTISRNGRTDPDRWWSYLAANIAKALSVKLSPSETPEQLSKRKELADQAAQIYGFYPRKIGRPAAITKIIKAIQSTGFDKVLQATQLYAKSWEGASKDDLCYCPHPSTWYHQQRFLDDPTTWQRRRNSQSGIDPNAGTLNSGKSSQYRGIGVVPKV